MQKENTILVNYKLICSKNSFLTSWCANYMECMPCEQMRNMPMVVILLSDLTHICHKDILRRNHTLTQSTAEVEASTNSCSKKVDRHVEGKVSYLVTMTGPTALKTPGVIGAAQLQINEGLILSLVL